LFSSSPPGVPARQPIKDGGRINPFAGALNHRFWENATFFYFSLIKPSFFNASRNRNHMKKQHSSSQAGKNKDSGFACILYSCFFKMNVIKK
jgi:hypothetical protein